MARIFAQHADAGQYHLETRFVKANQWEWAATEKKSEAAKHSGDATSLEGAKKAAAASIGRNYATCAWMNIGPVIELPD
jgi:hypothetical protein